MASKYGFDDSEHLKKEDTERKKMQRRQELLKEAEKIDPFMVDVINDFLASKGRSERIQKYHVADVPEVDLYGIEWSIRAVEHDSLKTYISISLRCPGALGIDSNVFSRNEWYPLAKVINDHIHYSILLGTLGRFYVILDQNDNSTWVGYHTSRPIDGY
jgi:hypothetical protein